LNPKYKQWLKLKEEVEHCCKCPQLVYSRRLYPYGKPTFGYGNLNSPIVFIGEAPGKNGCGTTGIPFTRDKSGRFYNRCLNLLNLKLEDIYTTNIVKCCPLNNRKPTIEEVKNCYPFLYREIQIIKPALIVALGRTAEWAIKNLKPKIKIPHRFLYHPAYILRIGGSIEEYTRKMEKLIKEAKLLRKSRSLTLIDFIGGI